MKNWLNSLLSSGGEASSVRVMAFISLLVGCLFGGIGLFMRVELTGLAALCGVFVGCAFTGKVIQKAQELKNGE